MFFFHRHDLPARFPSLMSCLSILLLMGGCVRNPVTRKLETKLISEATERRIGEEAKKEILTQYKQVTDIKLVSYVTSVGDRLARVSDRPHLTYDFTILDSDLVNAFSVPGGFVFVTTGLLEQLKSESQLAGVLGHEMGHVNAYHGVVMIQKEMGYGVLTTLGAIATATQAGPAAMAMMMQTANLFTNLYLLGYSREDELQADRLGFRYVLRAGYDPRGLIRFFQRLEQLEDSRDKETKGWDLYFRTHPPTAERIRILKKYMPPTSFPPQDESAESKRYLEVLSSLPREGFSSQTVIAGEIFQNKALGVTLTVPKGWVYESFHPRYIIDFSSPDGVVRGELRRSIVQRLSKPQDLASRVAKEMGFKFIGGRPVLYPCGYSYLARFLGENMMGEPTLVRMLATVRDTNGYALICFLPEDQSDRYLLPAEQVMRSFKLNL
jgi:predicted Zn-dependent protease